MNKKITISIALCMGFFGNAVLAETGSTSVQAKASIVSVCKVSAPDLNFGEIDWLNLSGEAVADGEITVFCNNKTSYTIAPEGKHGAGFYQFMQGTGTNKDMILVAMIRDNNQLWSGNNPIVDIGNASIKKHQMRANINKVNNPKPFESTATNVRNDLARPDNYSTSVSITVSY